MNSKVMKVVDDDEEHNNRQVLPDELIFYILSYLPISSLFKFRSVCKVLNTLFLHPFFLLLRERHVFASGLLVKDVFILRDYVRGMSPKILCQTSQGFLTLEATFRNRDDSPLGYRVYCPQLRQELPIPYPQNHPALCVAMEFVGAVVKLVSVHQDEKNHSLGYEVLSLPVGLDTCRAIDKAGVGMDTCRAIDKAGVGMDTCRRWRAIHKAGYGRDEKRKNIQIFFRMGVAYCFWFVDTDNDVDIQVDVLDMVNETYIGHTTFPRAFLSMTNTHLLDWNGRLSFAQLVKDELHVLVLDNYRKLKWAETKRIIKLPFLKPDNKDLITFLAFADNSVLFFSRQGRHSKFLCDYDITTGELDSSEFSNRSDLAELAAYHAAMLSKPHL